jgi:hypothetical protein
MNAVGTGKNSHNFVIVVDAAPHDIAKDPFRFSISDKKSSDNCASTFLDLPKSYLRYLNRGVASDGRGV